MTKDYRQLPAHDASALTVSVPASTPHEDLFADRPRNPEFPSRPLATVRSKRVAWMVIGSWVVIGGLLLVLEAVRYLG